jgi:hypothetical protein
MCHWLIAFEQFVDVHEIQQGGHAVEGGLDAMFFFFNFVASTSQK